GAIQSDVRVEAVSAAVLAVNPGSKVMNLGTIMACVLWAFSACRPVMIAPLQRDPRSGPFTVWDLDESSEGRILARLAQDQGIAIAILHALENLTFGPAERALRAASPVWDDLTAEISAFERLSR